jgi:hypothetical protein
MKIKVNYPGYWAHGKVYEAEREDLLVTRRGFMGDLRHYAWGASPTAEPNTDSIPCYIITKDDGQKFAIPCAHAVELVAEAA